MNYKVTHFFYKNQDIADNFNIYYLSFCGFCCFGCVISVRMM